jgi:hypothetical protein
VRIKILLDVGTADVPSRNAKKALMHGHALIANGLSAVAGMMLTNYEDL